MCVQRANIFRPESAYGSMYMLEVAWRFVECKQWSNICAFLQVVKYCILSLFVCGKDEKGAVVVFSRRLSLPAVIVSVSGWNNSLRGKAMLLLRLTAHARRYSDIEQY